MIEYYMWFKAFHIMAFMSWMAVLFYLPRLYVYHAEHSDKKEFVEVVKIQEYKLYYYIGHLSLAMTLLSGILMIVANPSVFQGGWLHAKLTVAILLIAYHFSLGAYRESLANDTCKKSGNFFRAYNEIPTIISLLIVVFAVFKTVNIIFVGVTLVLGAFVVYRVFKQKQH